MKPSTLRTSIYLSAFLLIALAFTAAAVHAAPLLQADDPSPPDQTVKLIFIHHSTGENWLRDDYGGLGLALGQNNYFVSDTNYGWGPEAIGDRTDIPNWPEWFRSDNTPVYMDAVFNESGQNSSYTRTLADPGGENEIVMFKSCFPNSELSGAPDDPPGTYEDFTVSGAKYVYNEILQYFATRPDKLFVVVTAPPVQTPTNAENARAFNQWLMNDWLRENNYTLANVAVFDFYNVLTGPDNHHRFVNGQIEHVFTPGMNTSRYPSAPDDDHPSAEGSRKATEEFVPLLNIFYHRWKAGAPAAPIAQPSQPAVIAPPAVVGAAPAAGTIDDFDAGNPADTGGWETFRDEAADTTIKCAPSGDSPHSGSSALQIDFDIAANSWGTCALFYGGAQDWSGGTGISFYLRAGQPALVFDASIYAGTPEEQRTYIYTIETAPESAQGWIPIELAWDQFRRAAWEEDADTPFDDPAHVMGMAFGFGAAPDARNSGTIWIDDVKISGAAAPAESPVATQQSLPQATPEPAAAPAKPGICGGAFALPLALIGLIWWRKNLLPIRPGVVRHIASRNGSAGRRDRRCTPGTPAAPSPAQPGPGAPPGATRPNPGACREQSRRQSRRE